MSKQSQQQHRRRPTAKRRARRQAFWTAGAMLIVFLFCLPLLPKFFLQEQEAEDKQGNAAQTGGKTVDTVNQIDGIGDKDNQKNRKRHT